MRSTRKPVEELSGRELDACVAEEVMGLNVVHYAWPQGGRPDGCEWEALSFMSKEEAESLEPALGPFDTERGPVYAPAEHGWPPEEWDGWRCEVEGHAYEDLSIQFHCHVLPVPRYSQEIAAAWQVVEKLTEEGRWRVTLHWGPDGGVVTFWRHVKANPKAEEVSAGGDHLAEAICRAALKAVRARDA